MSWFLGSVLADVLVCVGFSIAMNCLGPTINFGQFYVGFFGTLVVWGVLAGAIVGAACLLTKHA